MSMDSPAPCLVTAPLAHRIDIEAHPTQIADAVVETWQEIDIALTPIIGERGLAALYRRSIHVGAATHEWLTASTDGPLMAADFAELRPVFQRQTRADAIAGAATLFDSFHDLLVSMVGLSLTERLLRSVWAVDPSSTPQKDITP